MIFILDKQERVINMLKNSGSNSNANPFYDDVHTEDLATGAETFSFSTIAQGNLAKDLVVGNYVAFKKDRKYKLFQIMQVTATHQEEMEISVYSECAGLSLINQVFRAKKMPSATVRTFLESIVEGSEWNVGAIDYSLANSVDLDLEDSSAYATLQNNIGKFNGEIEFRAEINNGRVSKKFIDVYANRGKVTGKRFTFGKDIEGITKTIDSTELYTALIGRGKNGLTFKDVTVSGINKPIGQDFVADQESYELYNKNGYHLMGIFNFDTDSPEELLRETYKQLQKVKEPKATYDIPVALLGHLLDRDWEKVQIGDTIGIFDGAFNPPLRLMARVSKLETSFTNPQADKCTLSNFIEVSSNISEEMRKLASQLEGYVDNKVNDKFPIGSDDIEEGAVNGSHIYENSITTDHLIADCVTADKIDANQIYAEHIVAGEIKSEHIDADQITAYHIEAGTITAESGIIADAAIGTAQIKDAEVTVAKIQDLFVQDLVATQGKFQSAHIGVLTSDNIDANTIKAEHIKASVIDAINLNVEGKISADRIDVSNLTVDNIDAGKITTGELNADRIKTTVISAINLSTENATIDSAKIGEIDAGKITTGELSSNVIKTNVISAINAAVGKISADRIDVASIVVDNIDAGKITTGDLSADRIQSTVIAAINSYAGTAKIKQAQIETLKVGNANITDLDASKITAGKISAERIDTENLTVKSANITGEINASKISGGTLDASKITVTNLKADSITAGSITVQGENLIHNTAFKDFTGWEPDGTNNYGTIDSSTILSPLANSIRIISTDNQGFVSEMIQAKEGETYVFSVYVKTSSEIATNNIRCFILFRNSSNADINATATSVVKTIPASTDWQRIIVSFKAPAGTAKVCCKFRSNGSFNGWFTQPMLSKGSIASEWKLHNDELISNGAIDSNKIADEAVGVNKLNLEELFVSESAFIKKLSAVEINANKITTGLISGERIDLKGLISFEALDTTLQPLFDVTGDKTYINGGMIGTNTIKANSIDLLSGLTVQGPDNTTTFAIKSDGNVEINGLLRSGNFDEEKNTGYQLSTDGRAILNQAVVRGDIILPNAGITNYADYSKFVNLMKNTSFQTNKIAPWTNTGKTASVFSNVGYGFPKETKGITFMGNTVGTTTLLTYKFDTNLVKPGVKYTYSHHAWSDKAKRIWIGIYYNGSQYITLQDKSEANTLKENYNRESFSFTLPSGATNPELRIYHYGVVADGDRGGYWLVQPQLNEGDLADWTYSSADDINPVRMWAGASYEERENAPFKVMQNGDVYAYNANLTGVLYGEVDSGFVNILKDEISLVDDTALPETTYFKINTQKTLFNTDISLVNSKGTVIDFVKEDKTLIMNGVDIYADGNMTKVKFDTANGTFGGLNLISQVSSGHHVLRHSSTADKNGTMVLDSEGNQGTVGDFSFTRKNYTEDVKVDISGSLVVKTGVSSTLQNIEMRSVTNEGWGFYAT